MEKLTEPRQESSASPTRKPFRPWAPLTLAEAQALVDGPDSVEDGESVWAASSPFSEGEDQAAERAYAEASTGAYATVFPALVFDTPEAWCYWRFEIGLPAFAAFEEHQVAQASA